MFEWERTIRRLIKGGELPSVALDIRHKTFRFRAAYGESMTNEGVQQTTEHTLFDLASLTKVAGTLPGLLVLAKEERIAWDDRLRRYIPQFAYDDVTIRHLLMHTSGLPADLEAVPRSADRDVFGMILAQPLTAQPGTRTMYSDLGMILLGEVIGRISGQTLNVFLEQQVFRPLGMNDTMFRPANSLRNRIAPTECVDGVFVHGDVHDEKCWQMGGVSGSAGLFATVADMAAYVRVWMYPDEQQVLPVRLMRQCLEQVAQGRGLGWEVFDRLPPAGCGAMWSRGSFGHTGFTGTSLWIDPVKELSVVLLTNAVHYGRGNPIREVRRYIHDEIFASLCGTSSRSYGENGSGS